MIRYTTGTLADLTICINTAIDDLVAPIAHADGTLVSAVAQLNLLIDWTTKPVAHATGTLANAVAQYNALAAYYIFAIHFYILPIESMIGSKGYLMRGPKYFKWGEKTDGIICTRSMKPYGSINMAVLGAVISDNDHNALILNADVYSFPLNLSPVMTQAQRSTLNTFLEASAIPGDWLKQGDTFLYAAHIVTAMFLYLQRALTILGYPADPFAGLTLNTRYNQLTSAYQSAMSQAAADLGYTWDVVGNDQIRKIWKMMADQWGSKPISFGGFAWL